MSETKPEGQGPEAPTSPKSQTLGPQQPEARKKAYNQNWPAEQEEIFADWADIAACYRLLHDWSQKRYHKLNLGLSIPVILLTTLTGSANLSVSSIAGDDKENQKVSNLVIGGISIIAGILSTVSNFLRYAPSMEAHRIASLSWGKLNRAISVELALDRNDRKDSMDFLKVCRAEIDRLIEQSPSIPEPVLKRFETQFKEPLQRKLEGQAVISKPDICNYLEHTYIYRRAAENDNESDAGFKDLPPFKDASLKRVQEYVDIARSLNETGVPEIVVPAAPTVAPAPAPAPVPTPAPKNTILGPIDPFTRSQMYYLP
jgi:hypothetical protein